MARWMPGFPVALLLLQALCSVAWISPLIPPSRTRTAAKRANNVALAATVEYESNQYQTGSQSLQNEEGSFGWTDSEFEAWFLQELIDEAPDLYKDYTSVFHKCADCVGKWRQRYRGNNVLWKRLFKRDRVVKEVIEAIPIIDEVDQWIRQHQVSQNVTIIDLCSGKGYLSMILSEYLPPDKVKKFVLVDKAWPMCFAEPQPHHMNWDHIYANYSEGRSYFTTWPIPLHTSKQNLKIASAFRGLVKRLSTNDPVLVLGVHLCGTLSIQAINLFQQLPASKLLILKPCCLPGMLYAKEQDNFEVGRYRFPTKEVCAPGSFRGNDWEGPPRWQLQGKFEKWCMHLYEALKEHDDVKSSRIREIKVQSKGGYQNTFLFAEK